MLLEDKHAIVYGAGGAVGGAVACAFAQAGAVVHLAGRTLGSVADLAAEIGRGARAYQVDALDERAVEDHADLVLASAGRIDVSFNATGFDHFLGRSLVDLTGDEFIGPLTDRLRANFLTARAAARRMQTGGVLLFVTATPARAAQPLATSFAAACAGVEALSRTFAAELGPRGVRTAVLRSAGSPDAPGLRAAFAAQAQALGITPEEQQRAVENTVMLKHLPTLAEVADVAVFLASAGARGMTGVVANVTCGALVD